MSLIYLDAETLPCQDPDLLQSMRDDMHDELDEALAGVSAPGNYKDPVKIADYCRDARSKLLLEHDAKVEEATLKTSFDGGMGSICCIGLAVDDDEPVSYCGSEREILHSLFSHLTDAYSPTNRPQFIGHNIIGFDLPFIWKRCIILGVKPPIWFPRDPKPWSDVVFDTMLAWNGPGARAGGSMERICRLLGIPGKGEVSGADVWPLFQAGRIDEIAAYCRGDVARTREMHRRMTFVDA